MLKHIAEVLIRQFPNRREYIELAVKETNKKYSKKQK